MGRSRGARSAVPPSRRLCIELLEARLPLAADFGDAPAPYPTLLADNGARHEAMGPTLGLERDSEGDGLPFAHATGDDATPAGVDDEDGVVFGELTVGQELATVTFDVRDAPEGARLDAWIDFNRDGNWGGPGEQILDSLPVASGSNLATFSVPSWAAEGETYARIRLSTSGGLGVRGPSNDGEIEDELVTIQSAGPASGVFRTVPPIAMNALNVTAAIAADIDGDGDADVISAADQTLTWYENDGSESFTPRQAAFEIAVRTVFAADVDGDGDVDLLSAGANEVRWHENDGNQNFTAHLIATNLGTATAVVAADVDGDGDVDVVTSSQSDRRIAWYENNGAQSFTGRTISTTANGASGVATADVDGDGDLDVLSSSANDHKIAWYENNGSQVFTARTITTMAAGASSVATADVDGDGDLDVLSASRNDRKIAWYENDGGEVFALRTISTTANGAAGVIAADLDGDGDVDLASASSDDGRIAWYENNGEQSFVTRTVDATGFGAKSVVAADIDADGDLDLLSAASAANRISWFEQIDTATSVSVTPAAVVEEQDGSLVYTIRRIGKTVGELVASFKLSGSATNVIDYSVAGATMVDATNGTVLFPDGASEVQVTLTPLDDTDAEATEAVVLTLVESPDLPARDAKFAVGRISNAEFASDFGDAPAPYPTTLSESGPRHDMEGPTIGFTRDVEIDGAHSADATGDDDGTATGTFFFDGIQAGRLRGSVSVSVQNVYSTAKLDAWIDFNRDGSWGGPDEHILDSVEVKAGSKVHTFSVPGWVQAGETIARFRVSSAGNLGVGGVAADGEVEDVRVTIKPPATTDGKFGEGFSVAIGGDVFPADMDHDGDLDLVATYVDFERDGVGWFERVNNQSFFTFHEIATDVRFPSNPLATDLDGDGDLDVLAASGLTTEFFWFENNGSQAFTRHTILTPGAVNEIDHLNLADVDGDGDMDLLSAEGSANKFTWYENNGALVFIARAAATTGQGARKIVTADVDRDGDLDLVTASATKIAWHENNGTQGFVERTIYSRVFGSLTDVVAVDFDRDGDMDAVSSSGNTEAVIWHENDGSQDFTARTIVWSGTVVSGLTVFDLDGDGDLDVLPKMQSTIGIQWYANVGGLELQSRIVPHTGGGAARTAADMDSDGDLDILAAVPSGRIMRFFNFDKLGGDYNLDGVVDAADYSVWRDTVGSTNDLRADGSSEAMAGMPDGIVDEHDYAWWKVNFGNVLEPGAGGAGQGGASMEPLEAVNADVTLSPVVSGSASMLGSYLMGPGAGSVYGEFFPVEPEAGRRAEAVGPLDVAVPNREAALLAWVARRGSGEPQVGDAGVVGGGTVEEDGGWESVDEVFAGLGGMS